MQKACKKIRYAGKTCIICCAHRITHCNISSSEANLVRATHSAIELTRRIDISSSILDVNQSRLWYQGKSLTVARCVGKALRRPVRWTHTVGYIAGNGLMGVPSVARPSPPPPISIIIEWLTSRWEGKNGFRERGGGAVKRFFVSPDCIPDFHYRRNRTSVGIAGNRSQLLET